MNNRAGITVYSVAIHIFYVLLIIALISSSLRNSKKYQRIVLDKNIEISNLNQSMTEREKKYHTILSVENRQVEDVILTSVKNESYYLSEIVKDKPMLVFRFSNTDCFPCIEHTIGLLNILADSIGKDNIALISRYEHINYLKILHSNYKTNYKMFNYSGSLIHAIDTCDLDHKAIVFFLDKNLYSYNFHFVRSSDSISSKYYKYIIMQFRNREMNGGI